ncbi:MAG: hypothetical protein ACD_79C00020G0001, partial [uncultured bacterium]
MNTKIKLLFVYTILFSCFYLQAAESESRIPQSFTLGLGHKQLVKNNFTDGDSSKQGYEKLQFLAPKTET